MDIIYTFVAVFISTILFAIIFDIVNQSFKVFEPLKQLVKKVKRKNLLRVIINAIGIILSVAIKEFFNLNAIECGILLSFFVSLTGITFGPWNHVKKVQNT
jgi:uncharacterized protein YacL